MRLEEDGERLAAAKYAAAHHLNVAQTEQYVERRLAAIQSAPAPKRTYIIKDVRLFLNSLDRQLRLIRSAGVNAREEREETEEEILVTIRIPKGKR